MKHHLFFRLVRRRQLPPVWTEVERLSKGRDQETRIRYLKHTLHFIGPDWHYSEHLNHEDQINLISKRKERNASGRVFTSRT